MNGWNKSRLGDGPFLVTADWECNEPLDPDSRLMISPFGSGKASEWIAVPWIERESFLLLHKDAFFVCRSVDRILRGLRDLFHRKITAATGRISTLAEIQWVDLRMLCTSVIAALEEYERQPHRFQYPFERVSGKNCRAIEELKNELLAEINKCKQIKKVICKVPDDPRENRDELLKAYQRLHCIAQEQTAIAIGPSRRPLSPGKNIIGKAPLVPVRTGHVVDSESANSKINYPANTLLGNVIGFKAREVASHLAAMQMLLDSESQDRLRQEAKISLNQCWEGLPEPWRQCFGSDLQSLLNNNGHLEVNQDKLRHQVNNSFKKIEDLDGDQPPLIAQQHKIYSMDRYAPWPACDPELTRCRDLFRYAELLRLSNQVDAEPEYSFEPVLRSWKPNIAVYRRYGIRVIRPAAGQMFISGSLIESKIRCLLAITHHRRYRGLRTNDQSQRKVNSSPNELLRQMFVPHRATSVVDEPLHFINNLITTLIQTGESAHTLLTESDIDVKIKALLETMPLGLPDSYTEAVAKADLLTDITEPDIRDLTRRIQHTSPFIRAYCRDRRIEVAAKALRLDPQDVADHLQNLISSDYGFWLPILTEEGELSEALEASLREKTPTGRDANSKDHAKVFATLPRQLMKDIVDRKGGLVVSMLAVLTDKPGDDRMALFEFLKIQLRSLSCSLGGRLTGWHWPAALRREEYLKSHSDLTVSVAYEIIANGMNLVALTDDEFLVECAEDEFTEEDVREVAERGARRLLGPLFTPIKVEQVCLW